VSAKEGQSESTYRVLLDGTLNSAALDEVSRRLSARFAGTAEQMKLLLSSPGYVLKKGISKQEAEAYQQALAECGANGVIKEDTLLLTIDLPDAAKPVASDVMQTGREAEDEKLVRRLADYKRLSGFFWIGLGILQLISVFGAIAGVWNIIIGFLCFPLAKRIRNRDPSVPKDFEPVWLLVVIGLVNIFLGGLVGVAIVAFEFFIRDKVLSNQYLFGRPIPNFPLEPTKLQELNSAGLTPGKAAVSFQEPMTFPPGTTLYAAGKNRLALLPDSTVVLDDGGVGKLFSSAVDYRGWARDREAWEIIRQF
jgi:hypothetical protein